MKSFDINFEKPEFFIAFFGLGIAKEITAQWIIWSSKMLEQFNKYQLVTHKSLYHSIKLILNIGDYKEGQVTADIL